MARLLRTQKIASTTDFQVTHSNLEAGTKFGEISDGGKPLFCNLGQLFVGPVSELGIGVAGGAAYTAPELMQLRKTETVGIFNN